MRDVSCVVLAAGSASRMGGEKLTRRFRSGTILDAVLDACSGYPTVVVGTSAVIASIARPSTPHLRCYARDDTQGMAHSLRLANAVVPAEHAIAVLLADKPLVTAELIERVIAGLGDADVAFPQRDGVPGHPVVFSPIARALIIGLPDGDNIHLVRDNDFLERRALEIDDAGAYVDVDTEEEYRTLINDSK